MPEEVKVETPAVETVVSEPQVANLKDDDLVEIVWKGETIRKPWKEARANVQMQEDYTRSKQAISDRAKQLEDLYNGLTAKEKEIAAKELALDTVLGRAPKRETVVDDPNEVLTRAQLQAAEKSIEQRLRAEFDSKFNETLSRSESTRQFQRWEDLTNQTEESLVKEHPALKSIPNLAIVLKLEAMKDRPNDEKEMVAAIVKAGKQIAKSLDDVYVERRKAELAKKNNLTSKGSEPVGGRTQFEPPKKSYGSGRKINWDEIENDVKAAIDGLEE